METWRNKQRGRRWWSLKSWGLVRVRNTEYSDTEASVALNICLCRYYNGVSESGPRLVFDIAFKPQTWYFASGSLQAAQFYLLYFTCIELWLVYQARIVDYAVICGTSTEDCVSPALEAKPQVAWQYPADWPSLFSNWCSLCAFTLPGKMWFVWREGEDFTVFARGEKSWTEERLQHLHVSKMGWRQKNKTCVCVCKYLEWGWQFWTDKTMRKKKLVGPLAKQLADKLTCRVCWKTS